jgi:hypothetical protein
VTTVASLQGSLEEFPLDAVVSMLSRSGQIGALEVHSPGLGAAPATVWFGSGNVHAASREEAIDTLFQLLVTGGGFEFHHHDDVPAGHDVVVPAVELLASVEDRLAEWRVIASTIPSTAVVLRLAGSLPAALPVLEVTPEEWQVLAQLDGVRTVAEVTRAIGVEAFEVCRLLHRLRTAGAVEPVESEDPDGTGQAVERPVDER